MAYRETPVRRLTSLTVSPWPSTAKARLRTVMSYMRTVLRPPATEQRLREPEEIHRSRALGRGRRVAERKDGPPARPDAARAAPRRQGCPEWDSNPHLMVFETISSAVGISGLMSA